MRGAPDFALRSTRRNSGKRARGPGKAGFPLRRQTPAVALKSSCRLESELIVIQGNRCSGVLSTHALSNVRGASVPVGVRDTTPENDDDKR